MGGSNAAHRRGWVHRDVKPSNILIDTNGLGYMADFDLVRAEDTTRATRTAAGMGTFVYAAPEQLEDAKNVDARADVYAAAMTVLFVLGRKNPPPLVMSTEPDHIDGLGGGDKLAGALRGALAYRRNERTTTCAELITALREPDTLRPDEFADQRYPGVAIQHLLELRGKERGAIGIDEAFRLLRHHGFPFDQRMREDRQLMGLRTAIGKDRKLTRLAAIDAVGLTEWYPTRKRP
jgi:serine/threonine protein kinase